MRCRLGYLWLLGLWAIASSGCAGLTQNPSYIPFYLPTGDIIRTHAKPPGLGYFANFDRRADRVEVTPTQATHPTRTQVVLIATVYDREGDARRKRRVEWMLDGPGHIVEVDESGYTAGRGYKVDNKYAVSYTDLVRHTLTRGTEDPSDDIEIRPGQTWCVVTSPVEGETSVMVYAPGVHDWDKGRVFARLVWRDGEFQAEPRGGLPPSDANLPGSRPSAFDDRNNSRRDATLTSQPKGPSPPQLSLDVQAAKVVSLNRDLPITIVLANVGRADGQPLSVRTTLPEGVEFVRADPAPTRRNGPAVVWHLDGLRVNHSRTIQLVVQPRTAGRNGLTIRAETDDLSGEKRIEWTTGTSAARLQADAPTATVATGEVVPIQLTVSNIGTLPLDNARVWVDGDGLRAAGSRNDVPRGDSRRETRTDTRPETHVGNLAVGQSRTVTVPLRIEKSGSITAKFTLTADGGLSESTDLTVTAGRAELDVSISASENVPLGQDTLFEIRIVNRGDLPLADVVVRAELPREFTPVAMGDGQPDRQAENRSEDRSENRTDRSGAGNRIVWQIGPLAAGAKKAVRVNASARRLANSLSVTATADGALADGQRIRPARAAALVNIVGQPALVLELADWPGALRVGSRARYRVIVRNRGTATATAIELAGSVSPELRLIRGEAPTRQPARLSGSDWEFPPLPDLRPGESVTVTLEADAIQPGSARFAVQARCRELPTTLRDEQAISITSSPIVR